LTNFQVNRFLVYLKLSKLHNFKEILLKLSAFEIGKRDNQMLGGGPSSGQVNAVLVQGKVVGDAIRKATLAEHRHMPGRFPSKHSTQPVRSAARSDITHVSARNLGTGRPKTKR
jgi:hypothetical protein